MRFAGSLLATATLLLVVNVAQASDCGCAAPVTACGGCAAPCAPQMVKKTILVPTMVTEERTVCETQCVAESRTRNYTVCEIVPVTKTVQRCYTTSVPETRTRSETYCVSVPTTREVTETYQVQVPAMKTVQTQYTVCVPVWTDTTEQYTVMVPATETRQGTRCEQHCVPVKQTCTRCVDKGHWEERQVPVCNTCNTCSSCCAAECGCGGCGCRRHRCCHSACYSGCGCGGGCGGETACGGCAPAPAQPCTQTVRCYVPNWVNETYEVTVNKYETVQVPCTW